MKKRREEICGCCGRAGFKTDNPHLLRLAEILHEAEQKRKAAEAAQGIGEPPPDAEPLGKPEGAFYTPSMDPCG